MSTVWRTSTRYKLAACAPIRTVSMPAARRRALRSSTDESTFHGLTVEFDLSLQRGKAVAGPVGIGGVHGRLSGYIIAQFVGF